MINLVVCSHVSENREEKDYFHKFKNQLEETLQEKVALIFPQDYLQELEIIKNEKIDIYFASPVNAYRFYKKGYIPFCKKDKHRFVLIGNLKKDNMTISIPYYENFFIVLLLIEDLDLLKTEIIYTQNEEKAYKNVVEGKTDIAILYKENYFQISEKYKHIPFIKELKTDIPHFFMLSPSFYKKNKEKLGKLKCNLTNKKEFLKNINIAFQAESLVKIKTFFDIAKSVYENEYIGTFIYKDKIVYASKSLEKILGYSLNEIRNLSPIDLFGEDIDIEEIKGVMKRRLKGEQFAKVYPILKFRSKDGTKKYIKGFTKTIIFEEDYAGLAIFIDITKEVRYQKVFNLLRKINKLITNVLSEDELFSSICKNLEKEFDIEFIWVAVLDPKDNKIKKIYKCGKDKNYLEKIKIKECCNIKNENSTFSKAIYERKIIINSNTHTNNDINKDIKNFMLERNFLSSASIPIEKDGEISAVLNIYASEPYFFEEEINGLLEEIKHDLSFALKKIETIKDAILLKNAIEKSDEWFLITDENGKILYINDYVSKISGYEKEEIIGNTPRIFKSGYQPKEFYKKLWKTILSGKEFEAIFINRKKNGELFYLEEKIIPVKLPDGTFRFISIGRDITKEITLSQENEKLRYFDVLTDLYNYNGFRVKVESFISKKSSSISALLILDIANFSYINKTYGINAGDKILKEIGILLKQNFRDEDIIARIGGDEFTVFFVNLKDKNNAIVLEHKIKNIFERDIKINHSSIRVFINGGIAVYPDDGTDFYTLYGNASIALKEAKNEGENIIKFFNKELESKVSKFVYAGEIIEKAIKEKLFVFYYQPYFQMENLKIAGFEALVRIKDKDGKIYYPNDFIDYLENSAYLKDFETWSLREITRKIIKWNMPISINISAKTFKRKEFIDEMRKYTKDLPNFLVLEITERLYIEDILSSSQIIQRIKKYKNIKLAIDDFGTGYSSLSYLKDINADILKIDISFVKAMVEDKKSRIVVKTIVNIAKELGMETLAEGVETEKQLKMLKDMGVDYVQGFLLSKPLPEEEIERDFSNLS